MVQQSATHASQEEYNGGYSKGIPSVLLCRSLECSLYWERKPIRCKINRLQALTVISFVVFVFVCVCVCVCVAQLRL